MTCSEAPMPLARRSNTMAAGAYLSLGGQSHTQPALTTAGPRGYGRWWDHAGKN